MKFTLIQTFFRSLNLSHLERSLYSLSRQTVKPDEYILFDNNTDYSAGEIKGVVESHFKPGTWDIHHRKHGDSSKTMSFAHNSAIKLASNDTFLLARSDIIYDFTFCERMLVLMGLQPMRFCTSHVWFMGYYSEAPHESVDHAADLEPLNWRADPSVLFTHHKKNGQLQDHPELDAPSFLTTKQVMERVNWYDENLNGWGYDQQDLQRSIRENGVETLVYPAPLQFHMLHQLAPEYGERSQARADEAFQKTSRRLHGSLTT